jgi:D-sedoheptulose 7-phosphate isomerase
MRKDLNEEVACGLQWAFPVIPLTGFSAFSTAFSNDVSPVHVFAQLVLALGQRNDVLGVLSTSGNSPNVCIAARLAHTRGLRVLALTGKSGGKLRELADVCICVPATQTPHVQELHLPIYHCLSLMLEEAFAINWSENPKGKVLNG